MRKKKTKKKARKKVKKVTKKKARKKVKKVTKKKARKKVKKVGRPSQYKSRYCRMLIKFFDVEPFTEVYIPHYDESGKKYKSGPKKGQQVVTHLEIKKNPNRTPTLQRFAKKIKVGIRSVYRWLDEKDGAYQPEFRHAFACARELRRNFLIENGLHGCHQHSYAKFVAVNLTDMKDSVKQELVGEEGGPLELKIVDFSKVKINEIEQT